MRNRGTWLVGALFTLLWSATALAHDFGGGTTPNGPPDSPNNCPSGNCCRGGGGNGGGPGFGGSGVGDPIWTYNGTLHLRYVDLEIGASFPIRLARDYDSKAEYDTAVGYGWSFEHDRRLFEYPDGSVVVRSGCGRRDHFVNTGGAYVTPRDGLQGTLVEQTDGTYEYRYANGKRDLYDADGRLVVIENKAGQRHELIYDARGRLPLVGTSPRAVDPNKPMVVAYQPRLTRIQERDSQGVLTGYAVNFEYNDSTGRLTRIVASDGRAIAYTHDETAGATRGNLRTVAGLVDYVQAFSYTDTNDAHNITAIVDGTDAEPVVNTYNVQDQVTRQVHGGSTIDLAYLSPGKTQVTETVRNAAGAVLQTRVSTREFDEAGYLTKETNPAGHEQRYAYNASKDRIRTELWEKQADGTLALLKAIDNTYNGQAQKLTESVTLDSGEVVTTTWTYDHGWMASEQKSSTASPQVFRSEFEFVRDGQGVPINIAKMKGRNDDGTFATTTYVYCSAADAAAANSSCPDTRLVKQIDGPRTDVADVITLSYYGTTDTSGCGQASGACQHRGDLKQTSNAAGHTVDYLRYDATGRPARLRDTNGAITEFTYDQRGRILEQIARGLDDAVITDDHITVFLYDVRGNLRRQTHPDGSYIESEYDARNRLVEVRDTTGSEVRYTLDSVGNRLKEEIFDPSGSRRSTLSRTFDVLDRELAQLGAQNQTTTFTYDGAGRQTLLKDPLNVETRQIYDDLDRSIRTVADATTDGIQASTQFVYDADDNLRQVIDPKGLATTYQYNAWGQLTQLVSPDTGTIDYTYDAAGNRKTQNDARNETATYAYDALNRLVGIGYSDSSYNVTYAYDVSPEVCEAGETFAKGRLATLTDASGSTHYCYDHFGQLVRKVQTTSGKVFTLRFGYTPAGRMQAITYPDGSVVDYGRDTQGRIQEVGVALNGQPRQVLLTESGYYPFGLSSGWTYGNGRVFTRQYDLDLQPQLIRDAHVGGLDLGFKFNASGQLTQLHTAALSDPPRAKFEYDDLGRLTHFRDGATNTPIETYDYDATGNRTQLVNAAGTQAYTYPTGSHRLMDVDGTTRTYDAAGNTTSIGGTAREFVYNPTGRLSQTKQNGVMRADYSYNGKGEQVRRNTPAYTTHFVYDEDGQLLGQYDTGGNPLHQYIWLDDLPVGVIANGKVYYVQPDHLGTPRSVIDPQRQEAVWSWDLRSEAFGNSPPNADPDGDGVAFAYDLRFPGQRYDMASGLNYNYFRDYEPAVGRYLESDPVGLEGGINTYLYASANPLGLIDPTAETPVHAAAIAAALLAARIALKRCMRNKACRCRVVYGLYKTACGVGCKGTTCAAVSVQVQAARLCYLVRMNYIRMGCDRVIPTTRDHPGQAEQARRAWENCEAKRARLCVCG